MNKCEAIISTIHIMMITSGREGRECCEKVYQGLRLCGQGLFLKWDDIHESTL